MVTTGGTGPAPRDVTPDATEAVSSFVAIPAAFKCCSSRALPITLWNYLTGRREAEVACKICIFMVLAASEVDLVTLNRKVSRALCFAVQVCERMMPGYGEQMRAISLRWALALLAVRCPQALCFVST